MGNIFVAFTVFEEHIYLQNGKDCGLNLVLFPSKFSEENDNSRLYVINNGRVYEFSEYVFIRIEMEKLAQKEFVKLIENYCTLFLQVDAEKCDSQKIIDLIAQSEGSEDSYLVKYLGNDEYIAYGLIAIESFSKLNETNFEKCQGLTLELEDMEEN
jgi:hypothetical protein